MRFFVSLLLLPFALVLGKIFGGAQERVLRLLIRWNNRLVARSLREKGLLLLLPVCLKSSTCDAKILDDVYSCRRCGKCKISDLLEYSENKGIDIEVASGGGLAKEIVLKKRPNGVVAIACEKELASGISEIYPVPVYGIVNNRPEGPCKNTQVDIKIVSEALGITDESSKL